MAVTPPDLALALTKAGLADFFTGCTASHRREYLQWIDAAKRPETRKRRIDEAVAMLAKKQAGESGPRRK
jgi:uncharacterized protein YdeI (YjbR/CyaY-like superfamily)